MHHTDQNKKPTGDATSPAGHTDILIIQGVCENDKEFATLAAEFALAGHGLIRSPRGNLYCIRWGQIKPLDNLIEAAKFLRQIGGAN